MLLLLFTNCCYIAHIIVPLCQQSSVTHRKNLYAGSLGYKKFFKFMDFKEKTWLIKRDRECICINIISS